MRRIDKRRRNGGGQAWENENGREWKKEGGGNRAKKGKRIEEKE